MPQSTIQCMGTPRSQVFAVSSASCFDIGLRWTKRAFSRASMASMASAEMVRGMISLKAVATACLLARREGGFTTPMDLAAGI